MECPFKEGDIIHRTNFLGEEHILRATSEFIDTTWHYTGEFGRPVYRLATIPEKAHWYAVTEHEQCSIATRKLVGRGSI